MNKCLCSNLNTQSLFGIFSFDRLPHYKMAGIKKVFSFYSCPVSLDQIYLVLVLTSANHNARNRYPEMDTARTDKASFFILGTFFILFHSSCFFPNEALTEVRETQF